MKKIIVMIAVALMTVSAASAQSEDKNDGSARQFDKTEMAKHRADRLAKELGLNDDQTKQVEALNVEYADKLGQPFGRPGGRGFGQRGKGQRPDSTQQERVRPSKEQIEARRKEFETTKVEYDVKLKKILTADQYAKYEELQKQRMQNRGQRGPRPDNGQGAPETDGQQND